MRTLAVTTLARGRMSDSFGMDSNPWSAFLYKLRLAAERASMSVIAYALLSGGKRDISRCLLESSDGMPSEKKGAPQRLSARSAGSHSWYGCTKPT